MKTKQEIIEIIKPFMDKTLSEGCIIKVSQTNMDSYRRILYDDWNSIMMNATPTTNLFYTKLEITEGNRYEILWHYDLTAVLKYVNSKWDVEPLMDADFIYFSKWIHIPNKPLHLYTEQEKQKLLHNLKKLWTNHQKEHL